MVHSCSEPSMLPLPPELLDQIFKNVDKDTLSMVVKAHPILARIAEPHLYRDITVQSELQPKLLQHPERTLTLSIAQLWNISDHIGPHAHSLTIMADGRSTDEFLRWASQILPRLSNLKRIELSRNRASLLPSLEWRNLPKTFQSAFMDALNLSTMQEVRFVGSLSLPMSLLNVCRSIKSLTFSGCFVTNTSDAPQPSIESLAIYDVNIKALENIISWALKRRLRFFAFGRETDDDRCPLTVVIPLLRSCVSSLNNVEFDLGWFYNATHTFKSNHSPKYAIPDFPILPNLDRFSLHAQMVIDYDAGTAELIRNLTPFPALPNMLRIIPATLRILAVHLHFCIRHPGSLDRVNFSDIDHFVTKACSSSKVVHLYIHTALSNPAFSLGDLIASLMKYPNIGRLVEQGLLVILRETRKRYLKS